MECGQLTFFSIFARCYNDFVDRNMCRKLTWEHPDWSGVVTDTGALITTMKSGILRPIPKG